MRELIVKEHHPAYVAIRGDPTIVCFAPFALSGRCGKTILSFRSRQQLFFIIPGVIYLSLRFRFVTIILAPLQGFTVFSLSFVQQWIHYHHSGTIARIFHPAGFSAVSIPYHTFLHAHQVRPGNTYLAKIFQISKVQTFILPRSGFAQGSSSLSLKVRFRSRSEFAFAQGSSPKVDTYPPLLDNRP